jgi:hypothetical protein
MPDKNTNLPILDDIIKPGNTDKAAHQPATDHRPDSIELLTDQHSAIDAIDQTQVPLVTEMDDELAVDKPVLDAVNEGKGETRAPAIDLPDIDVLTEEILDNLILQIEPLLRDRIQQTLSRHFSAKTDSD